MYSAINALGCVYAAPAIVLTFSKALSYHSLVLLPSASTGSLDGAFIITSSLPSSSLYSSVLPAVPMSCNCFANLPNAVSGGAIPNRVDMPLNESRIPPPAFNALARKFCASNSPMYLFLSTKVTVVSFSFAQSIVCWARFKILSDHPSWFCTSSHVLPSLTASTPNATCWASVRVSLPLVTRSCMLEPATCCPSSSVHINAGVPPS